MKVLHLSDIHFRKEYSSIKGSNEIFDGFIDEFIKIAVAEKPDCLLITGDLAFSGTNADYQSLDKLIIERLVAELCYEPLILGIPGNHDVLWNAIPSSITEGTNENLIKRFQTKNSSFTERYNKSREDEILRFVHFSNWFEKRLTGAIKNRGIKTSLPDNDFLFGYVEDPVEKVVFILLNSSWLSWGGGFDKNLLSYIKNPNRTTPLTPEEIINIKNNSTEFGGQIVGSNLLEGLTKELKKWTDYTIITAMHHPLHWLEWSEYNSYGSGSIVKRSNLYKILASSDIFVTGHEHVPAFVKPRLINFGGDHDLLYIQSGMFLQDKIDSASDLEFPQNRFSIWQIDATRFVEKRFMFSNENSAWQPVDQPPSKEFYLPRKQKLVSKLTGSEAICEDFWKRAKTITSTKFQIKGDVLRELEDGAQTNFKLFSYNVDSESYLVVVPKFPAFYSNFCTKKTLRILFFHTLEDALVGNDIASSGKIHLTFLILDLFALLDSIDRYSKELTANQRLEVFREIVKLSDHSFDMFRVDFFDGLREHDRAKFDSQQWSEISLANVVQPFWRIS